MNVQKRTSRVLPVAILCIAVLAAGAVDARAACTPLGAQKLSALTAAGKLAFPVTAPAMAVAAQNGASALGQSSSAKDNDKDKDRDKDKDKDGGSIVGLWRVVMTDSQLGVIDFGFQQFHSDGTEFMTSGGVPPTIGNVCIGAWERSGNGAVRLVHVGWNFDPKLGLDLGVAPTGYFYLEVTARTNNRGTAYSGRFRAASYDLGAGPLGLGGEPQPGTVFEGTIEAVRISVE
jgi:hypothetical protein